MSFIENKKTFIIDSKKRTSGTDSNFTYELNIEPDDDFDNVVIMQCQIPKSYYLISQNRNYFSLVETDPHVLYPIYLNPGNYSRRALANTLQKILNESSPNNFSYEITYASPTSGDDGKYIFKVSNNAGVQPTFHFENSFLHEQLGFNKNSINTFVGNELKSVNVINLQLENTIFIHSDICQNPEGDNILQEVYASSGEANFSNIHYTCYDIEACSKIMSTSNSNIFRFYLLDEDNNEIYLNGLNIIITLMCYKKSTVNRMIKGFIKLKTLQGN